MEPLGSRQRAILVVDDDEVTRSLLCRWLEELGLSGIAKQNGYAGLSRLASAQEHGRIQGVLLDLQMRHFGGMAVLRELRRQHPSLPVIVMAESRKVEKVWQAMSMGAREFLLKPFDHKVFRQKCSTVFLDRGNADRPYGREDGGRRPDAATAAASPRLSGTPRRSRLPSSL